MEKYWYLNNTKIWVWDNFMDTINNNPLYLSIAVLIGTIINKIIIKQKDRSKSHLAL